MAAFYATQICSGSVFSIMMQIQIRIRIQPIMRIGPDSGSGSTTEHLVIKFLSVILYIAVCIQPDNKYFVWQTFYSYAFSSQNVPWDKMFLTKMLTSKNPFGIYTYDVVEPGNGFHKHNVLLDSKESTQSKEYCCKQNIYERFIHYRGL